MRKKINSRGFVYSNIVPLKINSTYVLRSIAYKDVLRVDTAKGKFKVKTVDVKGITKDIFVAFKVIGQEADGSVILLWRKLN